MLIITRRPDEAVEITVPETGDVITVMVTAVRGSEVRLGFDTPRHWNLKRQEVAERERRAG